MEGSGGGWQSGIAAGLAATVARERRERETWVGQWGA